MSEFWAYLHRACAETANYKLPVKNLTPPFAQATSISYKTDAFPLPSDVYLIYSMFLCYYLVTLTFDLFTLRVCHVQCFSCLAHILIFSILWLSVTELRVLNIWSHFRYLKQSLRMRRVTWPLTGRKNSLHFWNFWPQFACSLSHFHGATTKIKPCYRQKSVFPLWRLQSLLRMRSITWRVHRRSPKTTRNTCLTPNCLFTIKLLWGYDDD